MEKIIDKNIMYPTEMISDKSDNIWGIFSTSETGDDYNYGKIYAKNLMTSKEIIITETDSDYTVEDSVFDNENKWIAYTEYKNEKKCIWLCCMDKENNTYKVKITNFGRYDNPELGIYNDKLWIVWEDYSSGEYCLRYSNLNIKQVYSKSIEPFDDIKLTSPQKITASKENAYQPVLISDGTYLYLCYESFFNNRYHLVIRYLERKEEKFSEGVEIGFSKNNDQLISACCYQNGILVAWENSSPLEKGYEWAENVVIPGFGHGWRVLTKMGMRKISVEKGKVKAENINDASDNTAEIALKAQESSGCPGVFIYAGTIFVSYLSLNNNGWQIKAKYFDGKDWIDIKGTDLIQKQRVTPAVSVHNDNIYILGNNPKQEAGGWTQKNSSTWLDIIKDVKKEFSSKNYKYEFTVDEQMKDKKIKNIKKKAKKISEKPDHRIKYGDKKLNLYWGDIHMHSNLSGCSLGAKFHCTELENKYRFCKDVGDLDFAMNTDHDSMTEHEWNRTRKSANFNNIPGKFVTFTGYEWTCSHFNEKPNYGHYNVLYKDDGKIYPTAEYDSIEKLWQALEKGKALTIPHHPGCKTHPLDWDYFNEDFEPLVEIFQVRGSYEYDNCPLNPPQYGRKVVKNHSIQDGLKKGYKFGFTAGGEHEGVGVTAVYADALNRESIFEALKKRQVYGTTGDRIVVDFRVNGALMGSEIDLCPNNIKLSIKIKGTDTIKKIRIVRDNKRVQQWKDLEQQVELEWKDRELKNLKVKDELYYYIVVTQNNGQMAWSSPVFVNLKMINNRKAREEFIKKSV